MNNAYKKYKLLQEIIAVFNRGFEKNVFEDEDEHDGRVYDAVLDHMDLLWYSLTEKEKESLRKD